MNLKRALIAGVVVAIVSAIFSMLTCGWLFNWVYLLEPTNIWKPMEEVSGMWYLWVNLGGLFNGIMLALVYALLYKGIPGTGIVKGLWYGGLVWLIGMIPGMFATYTFMTVATTAVIYWTVSGLFHYLLSGAIIGAIYKEG